MSNNPNRTQNDDMSNPKEGSANQQGQSKMGQDKQQYGQSQDKKPASGSSNASSGDRR